jgi:hypothetical protein
MNPKDMEIALLKKLLRRACEYLRDVHDYDDALTEWYYADLKERGLLKDPD